MGDAAVVPVASGVADLVVCFMVLMDVEDLDRSIAELVAERPEFANSQRVPDFLHIRAQPVDTGGLC